MECYHKHQSSQLKRLLASALQLVMPCHRELLVDWIVGNPRHMPCLNTPEDNTVLGINMRLGEEAPPQAEFKSGARRT